MEFIARQIFDCTETGLIVLDSQQRIRYWNRWMSTTSGIPAESATGKALEEVFPDLRSPRVQRGVRDALDKGMSMMLSRALGRSPFPLQTIGPARKHFERMQHTVTITPFFAEDSRQCVIQITDVTAASVREPCLRVETKKVQRLASIVANTGEAVVSAELDGTIVTWNESAARLFQYSAAEMIGQSVGLLIPPDHRDEQRSFVHQLTDGALSLTMETIRVAKDGSPIAVKISMSPLLDETGRLQGVSSIIRDIRKEKLLQAELREAKARSEAASAAKSQFLANMSHEIRTPMNGVMGMTELLLDTELTEEQREFASTIHSSANFLMDVINDIFDFSKIEAGRLDVEHTDFVPMEVVNQTIALFTTAAQQAGLRLSADLEAELFTPVTGDPHRIQQILNNLVGNAIKFTSQGEIIVRGRCDKKTDETVLLVFEVQDTGIGVSEEARSHIFQPFTQADGSTTRNFGGTGLGLSLCTSLARLMGGEIGLHSTSGEGSTFWFTVCCGHSRQILQEHKSRPSTPLDATPTACKGHVLVVEDNRVNQKVATAILRKLNYEVDITENGPKGLEAMAEHDYDAVLMDCQMPVLGGIEATLEARRRETEGRIPIIAMTAQTSAEDQAACLQAGMDDFITKPISIDALDQVLDRWIANKSRATGD